jgi:hypothetical protein
MNFLSFYHHYHALANKFSGMVIGGMVHQYWKKRKKLHKIA